MTAAGNWGGSHRCCFLCFHVVCMGNFPGNGELLLQGTDRGMERACKTAGSGWTGEWENDKLKIKPAGTGYCKSIGEEFRAVSYTHLDVYKRQLQETVQQQPRRKEAQPLPRIHPRTV